MLNRLRDTMQASEFIAERLKRHHTQASLAKALGYSVRQVQRWEDGSFPIPESVSQLIRYGVGDARRIKRNGINGL